MGQVRVGYSSGFSYRKSQTKVPLPLLISTSTALQEHADDNLQRGSVSNLVSALSKLDRANNLNRNPLTAESDQEREFSRYEDATRSTPATSKSVSKMLSNREQLYEEAVIDRLTKLPGVTPQARHQLSYSGSWVLNDFSFRFEDTIFHS